MEIDRNIRLIKIYSGKVNAWIMDRNFGNNTEIIAIRKCKKCAGFCDDFHLLMDNMVRKSTAEDHTIQKCGIFPVQIDQMFHRSVWEICHLALSAQNGIDFHNVVKRIFRCKNSDGIHRHFPPHR